MSAQQQRIDEISLALMILALGLMGAGIWVGFWEPERFSLPFQVGAHLAIMLAGGLLKLGYVLRLAVQHDVQQHAPARSPGWAAWPGV